jgi:two-component system OmpR family sensor kinase
MGRLFWKFFAVFLAALVVAGVVVGLTVWVHSLHRISMGGAIAPGPAGLVEAAAGAIERGGLPALHPLFQDWEGRLPITVLVVDEAGREVFGRPAPRERLGRFAPREATAPDGHRYTLLAVPVGPGHRGHPIPRRHWPPPAVLATAGLVASLAVAWLLAGYLSKPIRSLRWAMDEVRAGRLSTRVAPAMGRRRDEVADLGRGFDRMTAELERLVNGQRRLLHDVSHELRSPLARLQAAVGLGRQNPARAEETFERVEREVARLDALVGELLTLSHLDAGTGGDPVERVELGEFVAAIADDARFEAEAAGKEVQFEGDAGEVFAAVHSEPLRRAFENVLRNAVKFTASGTTVEARATLEGGDFVLRVADRGPGIPAADHAAVFEPFHRADGGRARDGVGLGLAIAKRAVEIHGGTIQLTERDGGGLVVEIRLPRVSGSSWRASD